jgi:hypothetical protein
MNKSRPVYTIEVNDIPYLYSVGETYTAITIKPDPEMWSSIPDHMKVNFAILTPVIQGGIDPALSGHCEEVKSAVAKAIRAKIIDQKKTGNWPRNMPAPKPKEKKARTKKEIER